MNEEKNKDNEKSFLKKKIKFSDDKTIYYNNSDSVENLLINANKQYKDDKCCIIS